MPLSTHSKALASLPVIALLLAAAPAPLVKERTVRAPPAEVFKAFTTREGLRAFFAPDANVKLEAGGPYELYFARGLADGRRGSEGCTVVSFEKDKSLTFTWNFPPMVQALRASDARTRVQLTFEPSGAGTRVQLVQDGFQDGADWAKGRAYFDKSWDTVLARLDRRFRRGPVNWDYGYWGPVTTASVRFLAGAWRGEVEGVLYEEVWLNGPAGLGGLSRQGRDGAVEQSTLLELRTEGDELLLTVRSFERDLLDAPKAGAAPKRFVLEGVGNQEAVFVEQGSKAPTVLRYARDGESLIALVERADGRNIRVVLTRVPMP